MSKITEESGESKDEEHRGKAKRKSKGESKEEEQRGRAKGESKGEE